VTRLNTAEKDRLLHMAEYLKKTVVGQEEAVESVSNAIRLQRSGLRNPNSPPSFLFCGASGTGKTLLWRISCLVTLRLCFGLTCPSIRKNTPSAG
jgi:ATP-dependent Clp protease ATP-binding subunit ClpA